MRSLCFTSLHNFVKNAILRNAQNMPLCALQPKCINQTMMMTMVVLVVVVAAAPAVSIIAIVVGSKRKMGMKICLQPVFSSGHISNCLVHRLQ